MKLAHTQGKWEILIDDSNGITRYYLKSTMGGELEAEKEANAKIIEAIPAMIETLLFMSYKMGKDTTVIMIATIEEAIGLTVNEQMEFSEYAQQNGFRDAIKKLRGE